MRKSEEIAKRYKNFIVAATEDEVIRVIKQIQIEAIEETAKRCIENVKFEGGGVYSDVENLIQRPIKINEQSILQVTEQLKKELE